MPVYLRQSTASQEIPLGPFVLTADGTTLAGSLTIANTDIKIWKSGATTLASKNSGGATYISNGVYYCVLDATDTDTIGSLIIFISLEDALSVRVECVVLDEAVYDVMFGTTALSTFSGGAVASVTGNVGGNVTGSVGSVATGGITSASFATGAITADAIASDAITDAKVAADVTIASVTGAVGSVTGAVGSVTGNVGGNVAGSVGSVTGNVGGNVTGSVGSVAGNVGGNVTGSVGSVTGNVGGNVTGSVGSVASGGISSASFAAGAITASAIAADAITDAKVAADVTIASVTGSVGSVAGNVGGNVTGSVGSVTGNVGGNVTGSVGSVATGGIASTSFAAGAITAAAIAADAFTAAKFASDVTTEFQAGLATAAALATAQADLDTLTGTDGVILATTQANYAPAKAGDLMGLVNDAITAGKFDETTAFPLTSADTSATRVARTGADADTLKTLSDQIDGISVGANPNVILAADIATVTNQTTFTLATGADFNDAYNGQTVVFYDATNSDYPSVRVVSDYVGSTRTLTIDSAPDFTVGSDDSVRIFATAPGTSAPTAAAVASAVRTELATELARVDAAVSSRMATYTQPTGFLAATFPGTVASPTNITAGTITTTTNLTNLPTIPANWLTAAGLASDAVAEIQSGLSTLDAAGVRGAVGLGAANLDTQLNAIYTVAGNTEADTQDIQGRLPAALVSGRIDASVGAAAANTITASALASDAVAEIQSGLSTLTAADVRTAVGLASANLDTQLAAIVEDTGTTLPAQISALNNLSAAGVRAAVGLASANLDTQLADLPTNAELTAALASADDAVLAAIAALNNLSAAGVRAAVGLASANLDTQLADLPTNAELATALASADDAVLAAIASLNNLSAAQVNAEVVDALATDTYAEPTGVPAATASLAAKIGRLHKALMRGVEVTATAKTFLNAAGAAEWVKALSDDGETYAEGSAASP